MKEIKDYLNLPENLKDIDDFGKVTTLLLPRFKQVVDYPKSPNKVGEIFVASENSIEYFQKYRAIYKPVKWWQHRKESDLPEYLKNKLNGEVVKVKSWSIVNDCTTAKLEHEDFPMSINMDSFSPSTERDYKQQKRTCY